MVTIKLYTERLLEGGAVILPTILAEAPCRNNICFGLIWLKWAAAIEVEWSKKAKIAANENKNK